MKHTFTLLIIIALLLGPIPGALVQAQEAAERPAKAENATRVPERHLPPLTEMTFTGKIAKVEHEYQRSPPLPDQYVITDAKRGVQVPLPSGGSRRRPTGEGGKSEPDTLEKCVGKEVILTCKGFQSDGGRLIRIVTVTEIEVIIPSSVPAAQ